MHIFRIDQPAIVQDAPHLTPQHGMVVEIGNAIHFSRCHFPQRPLGAWIVAQNVFVQYLDYLFRSNLAIAYSRRARFVHYNHRFIGT